jgi:hypothetical protein
MLKRYLCAAAVAVLALNLAGCNGIARVIAGEPGGDNTATVLGNLQGCERHYLGTVSLGVGGGFAGSVRIDCLPSNQAKAADKAAATAPATTPAGP